MAPKRKSLASRLLVSNTTTTAATTGGVVGRPAVIAAQPLVIAPIAAPSSEQQGIDLRLFLVELQGKLCVSSTSSVIPEDILLTLRQRVRRFPREDFLSCLERLPNLLSLCSCLDFILLHPEQEIKNRLLQFLQESMLIQRPAASVTIETVQEWKRQITATWDMNSPCVKYIPTVEAVERHLDQLPFSDVFILGLIKKLLPILEEISSPSQLEEKFKEIIEMPTSMMQTWDHCIFYNLFHPSVMPTLGVAAAVEATSRGRSGVEEKKKVSFQFPLRTLKAYVTECMFYTSAAQEISSFTRRHMFDFLEDAIQEAKTDLGEEEGSHDLAIVGMQERYLEKRIPKGVKNTLLPESTRLLLSIKDWEAFHRMATEAFVIHGDILDQIVRKIVGSRGEGNPMLWGCLIHFFQSVNHPLIRKDTKMKTLKQKNVGSQQGLEISVIAQRGFFRMSTQELLDVVMADEELVARYQTSNYPVGLDGKRTPHRNMTWMMTSTRGNNGPNMFVFGMNPQRKRCLVRNQPWLKDLAVRDFLVRVVDAQGNPVLESSAYHVDPRQPSFTFQQDGMPVFRVHDTFLDSFFWSDDDHQDDKMCEVPQLLFQVSRGKTIKTTRGVVFQAFLQLVSGVIVPYEYEMYLEQNKFFKKMEEEMVMYGIASLTPGVLDVIRENWKNTSVFDTQTAWMEKIRQKEVNRLVDVVGRSTMFSKEFEWDYKTMVRSMEEELFKTNPTLCEYYYKIEVLHLLFSRTSFLSPLLVIFRKRIQGGLLRLEKLALMPWEILVPELCLFQKDVQEQVKTIIQRKIGLSIEDNITTTLASTALPELMWERHKIDSGRSSVMYYENVIPVKYPTEALVATARSCGVSSSYASLVWNPSTQKVYAYNDPNIPVALQELIDEFFDTDAMNMAAHSSVSLQFSDMSRFLRVVRETNNATNDDDQQEPTEVHSIRGATAKIPDLQDQMMDALLTLVA